MPTPLPTSETPTLRFLPATRCQRDKVFTLTADEFCQRAAQEGMRPAFTWNERFTGDTKVKPYFDQDKKYEAEPTEGQLRADEGALKATVKRVFPDARDDEIVLAQRHGWCADPGGKRLFKSSVRAWVLNRKMRAADVPALVRARYHPDPVPDGLDLTVFKKAEQLLGCVMACKDSDDPKRYLTPEDPAVPLHCFLAQHVTEADALVEVPTAAGTQSGGPAKKKRGRPRKNKETSVAGPSGTCAAAAGDSGCEILSGRGETLSGADYEEVLQDSSDCFGREYRMQETLTSIKVVPDGAYFVFPTKDKWCILKGPRGGKHDGNNPYVLLNEKGATFRCLDEECKAKGEGRLVPFKELPESLRDLFNRKMYGDKVADELMEEAKRECRGNIVRNFRREEEMALLPMQDRDSLTTQLHQHTCPACDQRCLSVEHRASTWIARCSSCKAVWPDAPVTLPAEKYPKLTQVLNQLNVSINIVNNVNNVTTVNNYNGDGLADFYADFSHDEVVIFEDPEENRLFVGSLQGTDMSMSNFAVYHFKNRFHCTDQKKWYEFRGHCWHEGAADMAYKEALGEPEFVCHYQQATLIFENATVQTEDVKRKGKMLRKLCVALEDGKFRERIVADSIMKFHKRRPSFAIEANTQNVLVFEDGLYDFETATFGPGNPDIAVTMCVPQHYVPFDPENEDCQFLLRFIHDILPDPKVADYMLKVLALSLTTDISQQYLWILNGCGGNGKSLLMRLIEECLGPYFQSMNPTFLTRRREEASSANEALMSLIKTRMVVFQEPEARDTLQAAVIKAITGGDTLTTRGNYGKQVKIRPTWKSFIVTNDIPMISETTTDAIWRRLRVILFPVKFVDHPDPNNPLEKKRDAKLDDKLTRAAPYFISILLHYFTRFKVEGLALPSEVDKATQKYQSDTDAVKTFIEENMMEDPTSVVGWTDLRHALGKQCPDRKVPGNDVLKAEFAKHGLRHASSLPSSQYWEANRHFRGFIGWKLVNLKR
jgi:P4 family phage/plasmid primase-like protien